MTSPIKPTAPSGAQLGIWDTVSVIVGIVVGVSIFRAPSAVFGSVAGPWQGLAVWAVGGVLTLIGALCYAELATTYPRLGGDYIYLTRAYGASVGFVFGLVHLSAVMTGSIGAMSFVFADYATRLWHLHGSIAVWLAVGVVLALTLLNMLGIKLTAATQNSLTLGKLAGVSVIVIAGLFWGGSVDADAVVAVSSSNWGLALIFVLYSYGGWNDSVFVAAEVRDVRRNMPRALLLGTCGITAIYLLVNCAYLWVLGFDGVRSSSTPAADVLDVAFGDWGARVMSVLVMISALGAVNGMIFTGSRVSSSLGADHRLFALLGRWDPRWGSPIWSLIAQAVVSMTMIATVGTPSGRQLIDRGLYACGSSAIPWDEYGGGFDTLVTATAPVFWLFMLLSGVSLFVLRFRDKGLERPFTVPLYPFVPLAFCAVCGFMLYSSLAHARQLALVGIIPLVCGFPLHSLSRRMRTR